ncbi:MAG: penicillin-binding protein 2 [Aeriscardovia sp.]|nr:penicillin-binding protein 2 [Aeriscardovia sp.]
MTSAHDDKRGRKTARGEARGGKKPLGFWAVYRNARKSRGDTTTFNSRTRILAIILAAAIVLCLTKLVIVQLIQGPTTAQAAANSRTVTQILPARRGEIVSSNGAVLAQSVERYTIFGDQKTAATFTPIPCTKTNTNVCNAVNGRSVQGNGPQAVAELLSPVIGISVQTLTQELTGTSGYVVLKKNVVPTVERNIEKLNISSVIGATITTHRSYPDQSDMGALVGLVNFEGKGVAGVEEMENTVLSGKNGKITYQQGADGQRIPGTTTTSVPVHNGGTVTLTINSDVQWYVENAIRQGEKAYNAKWSIGVVQDVKTGELLAVADGDANELSAQERGPRAFATVFEPGSLGKLITTTGLLEDHYITTSSQFTVPHELVFQGLHYKDAEDHPVSNWTIAGIVQHSSNDGMILASQKMSLQQRYDWIKKFGIGQPDGIGMPGTSVGLLRPWQNWEGRTQQVVLFGQGYAANALQMTNVAATLANGGVMNQQSLIKSVTVDGKTKDMLHHKQTRICSKQTAADVLNMMASVNDLYAGIEKVNGYVSAGKSGTAQVADPQTGQLTDTVADMLDVFPYRNPRFAVFVAYLNPDNTWACLNAGVTAMQIGAFLMQKYGIPESTPRVDAIPTNWTSQDSSTDSMNKQ